MQWSFSCHDHTIYFNFPRLNGLWGISLKNLVSKTNHILVVLFHIILGTKSCMYFLSISILLQRVWNYKCIPPHAFSYWSLFKYTLTFLSNEAQFCIHLVMSNEHHIVQLCAWYSKQQHSTYQIIWILLLLSWEKHTFIK